MSDFESSELLLPDPAMESVVRDDVLRTESFTDEFEAGAVSEQDFGSFEDESQFEDSELLAEYEEPAAAHEEQYVDNEFESTIGQQLATDSAFEQQEQDRAISEFASADLSDLPTADEGLEPEAEAAQGGSSASGQPKTRRIVVRPGDLIVIQCR